MAVDTMDSDHAILVIDHGSRSADANLLVERVADDLRRKLPGRIVAYAHMEIASPGLAEALTVCREAGALRVTILPYFLGPGRHTRETIPELAKTLGPGFGNLEIRIAEPIGPHPKMIEILLERANACD